MDFLTVLVLLIQAVDGTHIRRPQERVGIQEEDYMRPRDEP